MVVTGLNWRRLACQSPRRATSSVHSTCIRSALIRARFLCASCMIYERAGLHSSTDHFQTKGPCWPSPVPNSSLWFMWPAAITAPGIANMSRTTAPELRNSLVIATIMLEELSVGISSRSSGTPLPNCDMFLRPSKQGWWQSQAI